MLLVIVCLLLFLAHIKLTFINRTLIDSYNYSRKHESLSDLYDQQLPELQPEMSEMPKNMNAALQQFYSLEINDRRGIFAALCNDVHGHEFELLYRSTVGSAQGPYMASNLQEFLLSCSHEVFTKFFDTAVSIKNAAAAAAAAVPQAVPQAASEPAPESLASAHDPRHAAIAAAAVVAVALAETAEPAAEPAAAEPPAISAAPAPKKAKGPKKASKKYSKLPMSSDEVVF